MFATRKPALLFSVTLVALAAMGTARAAIQSVERISVGTNGTPAGFGDGPDISNDGRFVAFIAPDGVVPNDTNGVTDILLRDRQSGVTTVVSLADNEAQANGASQVPAVSDDGRFVAFVSSATNLVTGDTNQFDDVFVRDRQLGRTIRASLRSDGSQVPNPTPGPRVEGITGSGVGGLSISGNGLVVVFNHVVNLIVPNNTTKIQLRVFTRDLGSNTTELLAVPAPGGNGFGQGNVTTSTSRDGRFVAFECNEPLVTPDVNASQDVFVRDRTAGTTERISLAPGGAQAFGDSFGPRISSDGRFVTFTSESDDLIPGDTNKTQDVYLRDRSTGLMERISVANDETQGNGASFGWSPVSDDGRVVLFTSTSSNLVPGDTNAFQDVFIRDRQAGTTERINLFNGVDQTLGNPSIEGDLSGDGSVAVFSSITDLVAPITNNQHVYAVVLGDAPANRAPVANAPSDQTVKTKAAKAKVKLDGSGSSDPDGDKLTYTWREGETQIATGVKPTVKLKKGVHTITLEVRDPGGLTDTDEVVITVKKKKR
jgi:hypothetical protein